MISNDVDSLGVSYIFKVYLMIFKNSKHIYNFTLAQHIFDKIKAIFRGFFG